MSLDFERLSNDRSIIRNYLKMVMYFLTITVFFVGCSTNSDKATVNRVTTSTVTDIDAEIADSVYILRYDQKNGEEKRNVSHLIDSGFSMKAYFYSDGRGYIIPGAGLEEFTWGDGIVVGATSNMTYNLEDSYLILTDEETNMRFWYEKTDETPGEYPKLSENDLP